MAGRQWLRASLVVLVVYSPSLAQTYSDTVFNNADWTVQQFLTGSFSTAQVATGGNPDHFRRTEHSALNTGQSIILMHFKPSAVYDPKVSGAIQSIDFSFDLKFLGGSTGTSQVGYRLAVRQADALYFSLPQLGVAQGPGSGLPGAGWSPFSFKGLVASNFARYGGTGTIDFSANGPPITFGYLTTNTVTADGTSTTSGIDNWFVNVSPAGASSQPFTLNNLQGTSVSTDGSGNLSTGHGLIQANAGSTTPAGLAIVGLRQNNVFVSEVGVPASPPIRNGRLFAEVSGVHGTGGAVNTGIAIANPNAGTATITFHFTNESGVDTPVQQVLVPPNGNVVKFLNEAPFNGGSNLRGTFTFNSDLAVGVIALRGYYTERPGGSEFLITTLPVADTAAPTSTSAVLLPHFAEGQGWSTQIILVNPTDNTLTGAVHFFDAGTATTPALPASLMVDGQIGSTFNYTIPRRASLRLKTAGAGANVLTGSVRIVPANSSVSPSANVIFAYKFDGVTVSEAGVSEVHGNAFRMYAEASGATDAPGTVQTGIAIANAGANPTTVLFELFKLDGTPAGVPPTSVTLGPNAQNAQFLFQLFPSLALPFKGLLRISSTVVAGISVVGLRGRYNERPGNFLITTTPATNEALPATNVFRAFPHIVNGGGYRTQFIVYSGAAGQAATGVVRFFTADGTPLSLVLN